MWHLLVCTKSRSRCFVHTSWAAARDQIVVDVLPMLGRRIHPLMAELVANMTPERVWACASEDFTIKLREIRSHEPISAGV